MTATPGEQLAEINHALALAQTNLKRAFSALQKYEEAMGLRTVERKKPSIRCLAIWQKWLSENGPNTRQVITEATNTKLTERATPHTVVWDDDIDPMDGAFTDDTIFRVRALGNGTRGATPMVYFLWSQRWDVHPLFGVGPIKSEPSDLDYGQVETEDDLHPFPDTAMVTETEESARFATLAEWDEAYAPLFDRLVATERKPDEYERAAMVEALPDGADVNAAIAIAHRNAVLRSREPQTLLGVIQPPPASIDTEPDEAATIDWGDIAIEPETQPDRSAWEMIGNHNHLPHGWSDLCAVSQCQRIA